MVGVMVCEDNGAQLAQAEPGAFQSCPEGCARLGRTHAGVYQRPAIAAYESMNVDGAQREWNRQGDFPDTRRNHTSFAKRLFLMRLQRCGRWLHPKKLSFILYSLPVNKRFCSECMV